MLVSWVVTGLGLVGFSQGLQASCSVGLTVFWARACRVTGLMEFIWGLWFFQPMVPVLLVEGGGSATESLWLKP